jgi:hypothetical protein
MSRLQAGALSVSIRPTGIEEVVLAATHSLGPRVTRSTWTCPKTSPTRSPIPTCSNGHSPTC